MKFWELTSVFRSQPADLLDVFVSVAPVPYVDWLRDFGRYVQAQDRTVLDAVVPNDVVTAALRRLRLTFSVSGGVLRACPPDTPGALSPLAVAERYGPASIEEVLEFGSTKVPDG